MPDTQITPLAGNNVAIGPANNPYWLIVGPGLPADGAKGFAKGALFLVPSTAGALTYANVGYETSANFDPITLIPKVTTSERDAISSPLEGLLVYNVTTHKLNVRVAAAWEAVTSV